MPAARLGDPDGIACRFNSGWCLEPILDDCDACLLPVDGDDGDLAVSIFGDDGGLLFAARHAVRPFCGLVHPDIDRFLCLAVGVDGDAIEIIGDYVVDVERAIEEGNAIDADERQMLEEQIRRGRATGQPVDSAVCRVSYVKRLIRSDGKIVAGAVVAGQVPTNLRGTSLVVEALRAVCRRTGVVSGPGVN